MQDEFAEARVWAFPELDDDYDDDDLLCGVCDEYDFPELSLEPMKVMPLPMTHQPQATSNKFSALDEETDDEGDMLRALQQLSPNIQAGQKASQRQRNNAKPPQKLTKHRIAARAEQVKSGDISLPSLDLDNDGDYEAIWAPLMDSGAGRPCANKKKHFPNINEPMTPSKVTLPTATAEEVRSRGMFTVKCMSGEGNFIDQEFEDIDVDMPILGVTSLASHWDNGSQVIFRKHGGEHIHLSNNKSSNFVKRRGVYFIKLSVKKDPTDKPIIKNKKQGFTQPGTM